MELAGLLPLFLSHLVHLPPGFGPFHLQKVEYTLGEESEVPGQRLLSSEELSRQLEKLLKEGSSNQRIFDWIEVCFSWILGERDKGEVFLVWLWGHSSEFRSHMFLFSYTG